MKNRVALLIASVAASGVLAVGLAVAGFSPSPAPVASSTSAPATTADPAPITQVDTVYVAPQATPALVTVQKIVNAPGGEHENESGGDH